MWFRRCDGIGFGWTALTLLGPVSDQGNAELVCAIHRASGWDELAVEILEPKRDDGEKFLVAGSPKPDDAASA